MKIHCIKAKLMFRGRNFSLPRVKRHWLLFTYTAIVVLFVFSLTINRVYQQRLLQDALKDARVTRHGSYYRFVPRNNFISPYFGDLVFPWCEKWAVVVPLSADWASEAVR